MISLFTFKYPEAVVIPSNVEYEVVSARDICVSVISRSTERVVGTVSGAIP